MNSGPTLQIGSTGPDVRRLQILFVMTKLLDYTGIDGSWDLGHDWSFSAGVGHTSFGDDNGRWFDGQECRWCIRPFGLDDGKGAGCCQGFNEPRGRALGDHDQWAL